MSGITGICYLDSCLVDQENLTRMIDTLVHRGPDGANIWVDKSVGFGHRMLWTTPESILEKLPLVNKIGDLVVTADARIDNRDELIPALGLDDHPSEKITDSQLILAAYETWGEGCPKHLIGDFAFTIWDKRRQKLFCARDTMGVKPFYYYYKPDKVFVFASEIKALLCVPEVPSKLNELKVAHHLGMFFEDQEMTFYQDIFRLPAAHSLTISDSGRMQMQSYWALDVTREIQFSSQQEYTEAFLEVFTESVRCRLRSAFPVGSTLSGGLDSSSIACTARQILAKSGNQKLHTFSAIFPSLPEEDLRRIDERSYMDKVKALGGFESHDVRADKLNPLIDLLWLDDEAIPSPNIYIHQGLYDCANQHGVRVFLDGLDGDSTISHGWFYLAELTYTGHWRTLLKEVNILKRRFKLPRRQVIWDYCLSPLLREPVFELKQALKRKIKGTGVDSQLINSVFAKQVQLAENITEVLSDRPFLTLTSRSEHLSSLTTGLYPFALEVTDKASAKFSLEGRYPFFDRRLMEFCLALPAGQKFRQGWPRAILRSAMTNILPPEIQWRISKGNLGSNFTRRLLECERETLKQVMNQPQAIQSYINMPVLRAAYERYTSESEDRRPDDDMTVLFAATLALWLRHSNLTT